MQSDQFCRLKSWFDTYTRSYLTGNTVQDSPIVLKIDHTVRVCSNICLLARAIDLSDEHLRLAETIGLFHDLGRFEQYRRYRTFNDRQSANHAVLGIEVIRATDLLNGLEAHEQACIMDAVRFHNAPALPSRNTPAAMRFMRLIRDADKLDIWKVFADYYRYNQQPEPAIVQHLPDLPECEDAIINAIVEKRMAAFKDMKSLNDFRLLQLSWVFDLNFSETFRQAIKRGDLAAISRSLPDSPDIDRAVAIVMNRLYEMEKPESI